MKISILQKDIDKSKKLTMESYSTCLASQINWPLAVALRRNGFSMVTVRMGNVLINGAEFDLGYDYSKFMMTRKNIRLSKNNDIGCILRVNPKPAIVTVKGLEPLKETKKKEKQGMIPKHNRLPMFLVLILITWAVFISRNLSLYL